jgi:rSAM/selenodomain-associated transferase 1
VGEEWDIQNHISDVVAPLALLAWGRAGQAGQGLRTVQFSDSKILIFTKAPVPGKVKTRLARSLGAEAAARFYHQLVEHTVQRFSAAAVAPLECCCAPDDRHPLFAQLAGSYGVSLSIQRGGDLGERMANAASMALGNHVAVILVGGDCPVLTPAHIEQALLWLHGGQDAVLGPAEDGGYVLLGLRRFDQRLFEGIQWGENGVAEATRERLAALGWQWRELEMLWDLDRPRDLERYRELISHPGFYATAPVPSD